MFYLSDSRFPWILASAGLQQLFSQWTSVDLLPVDRWVTTFFSARLQAPSRFPFSHWFTYQAPVFPGSLLQPGVTTFCSAGLQLFAQHTERLSCAFPSEWFQHLSCDFPPFCLIWVATWISSYTGLPSSSYYFPSELCLPIRLTGLWSRLWSLMSDSNTWIVFPPFCPIWVAIWISSFTGLPSGSY